jgi:hypothetical protein
LAVGQRRLETRNGRIGSKRRRILARDTYMPPREGRGKVSNVKKFREVNVTIKARPLGAWGRGFRRNLLRWQGIGRSAVVRAVNATHIYIKIFCTTPFAPTPYVDYCGTIWDGSGNRVGKLPISLCILPPCDLPRTSRLSAPSPFAHSRLCQAYIRGGTSAAACVSARVAEKTSSRNSACINALCQRRPLVAEKSRT